MTANDDARERAGRASGLRGAVAVPDPARHARVLIDAYGSSAARRIAEMNTSFASVQNYWAAVLNNIVRATP